MTFPPFDSIIIINYQKEGSVVKSLTEGIDLIIQVNQYVIIRIWKETRGKENSDLT